MDNIFENVELGPPIEVFQLTANFNKDPHPDKVNLGVGGECPTSSPAATGTTRNQARQRSGSRLQLICCRPVAAYIS